GVGERNRAGGEERRPGTEAAEQSADRGPEYEADAERRSHETEMLGALLRRADVGHVGIRGRERGSRDAGDHAAREQPADHRRRAHDQVVAPQRPQRKQQYRAAPEAVAEVSEHRRAEELHQRVDERQPAAVGRRAVHGDPGQLHDEARQHRQDDAEADRVDQHRDEYEGERGPAAASFAHGAQTNDTPARCSRARSQYTGRPAKMIVKVTPVFTGSVSSALTTMPTEAMRNTAGTSG